MSQFIVYKNENKQSKNIYPYFVNVQNDLLDELNSRIVIPLSAYDSLKNTNVNNLCPVVKINNKDFVLLSHQITSVPKAILKHKIASLEAFRADILTAIDLLTSGI